MTTGVIYQLSGLPATELLAVSLFSLRKHYQGPVSILATSDCRAAAQRFVTPLPCSSGQLADQVIEIDPAEVRRHRHYATKPTLYRYTPYERTVYLDCDTIVVAPIEELFKHRLAFTQFSDWVTNTGKVVGRVKQWQGRSFQVDQLVNLCLSQPVPAINSGVFVFDRAHPALPRWETLTLENWDRFLTDELAIQLLIPVIDADILDDRWNCSCTYGQNKHQVKIWHLHGRRHTRKEEGKRLWLPWLRAALAANFAGLTEWAGHYDLLLRELLIEAKK